MTEDPALLPESVASRRTIAGVPGLHWGTSGECTFIGALVAALSVTATPFDYRSMMGCTGLAFRVRWLQGPAGVRWCPSSPVGEFRNECEAAGKATGWRLRLEFDNEPLDRLAPLFQASIEAGIPALAYDDKLNVGVIFGCEDDGHTVLMHDYAHGDETARRRTSDLKMFAILLEPDPPALSPLQAALHGISLGVQNFRRRHEPEGDESRGYWHGPLALEKWANDIALYDSHTDEERGTLFFVSWWNFDCLVDARKHAGPFLREVAPLFTEEARGAILCAADLYEKESELLSAAIINNGAFFGPWSGKTIDDWLPGVRQHEQQLLLEACAIETDAISALDDALRAQQDAESARVRFTQKLDA